MTSEPFPNPVSVNDYLDRAHKRQKLAAYSDDALAVGPAPAPVRPDDTAEVVLTLGATIRKLRAENEALERTLANERSGHRRTNAERQTTLEALSDAVIDLNRLRSANEKDAANYVEIAFLLLKIADVACSGKAAATKVDRIRKLLIEAGQIEQ